MAVRDARFQTLNVIFLTDVSGWRFFPELGDRFLFFRLRFQIFPASVFDGIWNLDLRPAPTWTSSPFFTLYLKVKFSMNLGIMVVMGGCHGFESHHWILDGHVFKLISIKNVIVCLKRLKIKRKRPGMVHLTYKTHLIKLFFNKTLKSIS